MTRIKVEDLRVAGIGTCPRAREWALRNGIEWRALRTNGGLDVSELSDITDGKSEIQKVVRAAKAREKREQL